MVEEMQEEMVEVVAPKTLPQLVQVIMREVPVV